MDLLTETPTGPVPADVLDRTLRLPGMAEVPPSDSIGARNALPVPSRLQRGARAESWADMVDAFGDLGFRLHPDTAEFPAVAVCCGRTTYGRYITVTYCEGDLSVADHDSLDAACRWIGVEDDIGSRFAFSL